MLRGMITGGTHALDHELGRWSIKGFSDAVLIKEWNNFGNLSTCATL